MKKRTLIAIMGIWVAIIPSLGLPNQWKQWVIVISGLAITVIALKKKYVIIQEPSVDNQDGVENTEKLHG
ncbi:MAG: hypothetical protein FGM57_01550 [Candidatus Taylorbacteria bacterium]|nr:hypothetical protein [Candidatus Taylorbacteria bacterium]